MNDPYIHDDVCIKRLYEEYKTHGKLIVALDFDDTIFDFHNAGHYYDCVKTTIKRCQKLGFYVVLFTGTAKEKWPSQLEYLDKKGIHVTCVNQNPIPLPFGNDGKIYYNILLDDRAGLGQSLKILNEVLNRIEEV